MATPQNTIIIAEEDSATTEKVAALFTAHNFKVLRFGEPQTLIKTGRA